MDQLDAMRVFLEVARAGSLSSAARATGLPVATVSRKVAALEKHLGVRLLSRTTRHMKLTRPGERYRVACEEALARLDAAEQSLAEEGREVAGLLTVTAPVVFGRLHVLPVVGEFLNTHRRADLRLLLSDRNLEMVEDGIDVAVRIGPLPDSSLVATRVGSIRRIACASPDYLRERGTPDAPEDLAGHDCVTFTMLASPERWSFPTPRGPRSVAVRSRLSVTTAEAAIDAARAGLGITRVLSYQAVEALADGSLRAVLERFEPEPLPVHVLHGEGRTPRPAVRAFASLAAQRLRAALRALPSGPVRARGRRTPPPAGG